MEIVINANILTKKNNGIASVTINIINNMISNKKIKKIILLTNKEINKTLKLKINWNEKVEYIHIQNKIYSNNTLWNLYGISKELIKLKPTHYISTFVFLPLKKIKTIKYITVVHDFAYKEYFSTLSLKNKINYYLFADYSIKKADKIWCVSNYTKEKLKKYFKKLEEEKILVCSGIDLNYYKEIMLTKDEKKSLKEKYEITKKSLLFVGTIEPRKNLEFLLKIMQKLAKENYELIVVGASGWGKSNLTKILNFENYPIENIKFQKYLSDQEIIELYAICDIYISTSKNEGFGLPQLEAMACGCPVITAHNSAMIEVVENGGITVEGWEIEKWINKIIYLYENKEKYIKKGKNNIKKFDFSQNFKKIIEKI